MKPFKKAPRRRDHLRGCQSEEEAQLFVDRWGQLMGIKKLSAHSELAETAVIDLTMKGEIIIALPRLENVEELEIVIRKKQGAQLSETQLSETQLSETQLRETAGADVPQI